MSHLPVRSMSTSGRPSTTSVNFVTITRRGSSGTTHKYQIQRAKSTSALNFYVRQRQLTQIYQAYDFSYILIFSSHRKFIWQHVNSVLLKQWNSKATVYISHVHLQVCLLNCYYTECCTDINYIHTPRSYLNKHIIAHDNSVVVFHGRWEASM